MWLVYLFLASFLMAYGNAMNNVTFRRREAIRKGKDVAVPSIAYRSTGWILIALGVGLAVTLAAFYWLGKPLPFTG